MLEKLQCVATCCMLHYMLQYGTVHVVVVNAHEAAICDKTLT